MWGALTPWITGGSFAAILVDLMVIADAPLPLETQ
jgi:hypothetical protein